MWIEWIEPFGLFDEVVYCRVSREDAITTQKRSAVTAKPGFVYSSDEAALDDFITVRWAKVI
jgi:hypothetical protein